MNENGIWSEVLYQETVGVVFLFLLVIGVSLFLMSKKNPLWVAAWASLKSWFLVSPLLLFGAGLPDPWPLVLVTLMSIYGVKTFYRIVGLYHRSWFVWTTYLFVVSLALITYQGHENWYDRSPMIFLGVLSFIPLLRNSATQMIQYMALSLMGFIFLGWSLMHLGRILMWEQGIYLVIYIFLLSEFAEVVSLITNRTVGKIRLFSKISQRVSIEGLVLSLALTLTLAWGLRHLLPNRSEPFWILGGVCAALLGRFGDLIIGVIRRDLGIKDSGPFIIGRDDILARLDKYIFTAPAFYYGLQELARVYKS